MIIYYQQNMTPQQITFVFISKYILHGLSFHCQQLFTLVNKFSEIIAKVISQCVPLNDSTVPIYSIHSPKIIRNHFYLIIFKPAEGILYSSDHGSMPWCISKNLTIQAHCWSFAVLTWVFGILNHLG